MINIRATFFESAEACGIVSSDFLHFGFNVTCPIHSFRVHGTEFHGDLES